VPNSVRTQVKYPRPLSQSTQRLLAEFVVHLYSR
jgi:hypothetical protein